MMPENNQATIHITAVVVSGRGIASREMHSGNDTFKIKAHIFVPGTLNLVARKPIVFNRNAAETEKGSGICFYPIHLDGTLCWVRRYPQCPLHVFEVVSEVQLRNTLKLEDGDALQLEIPSVTVKPLAFTTKIGWQLVWKRREHWFYNSTPYSWLVSKFSNIAHRMQNFQFLISL